MNTGQNESRRHLSKLAQEKVKRMEKRCYVLTYLLRNGVSSYKVLYKHRPGRVKLRGTVVWLCKQGYVDIVKENITTPQGRVLKTNIKYDIHHAPQAYAAIQQWQEDIEELVAS